MLTSKDSNYKKTCFVDAELKPECPVCGTVIASPPLYTYTADEAAAHFCPKTRSRERNRRLIEKIRSLWYGEETEILQCSHCGFVFGNPFVGGDAEFYSILHEQKGYPAWRWDYDFFLKHVVCDVNSKKILDIGAGVGMFLHGLPPTWAKVAVESTDSNRTDLESAGIRVVRNLNALPNDEAKSFVAITLFQVLEHLADFRSVLLCCKKLLNESGVLCITVPDWEAMIRQERLTGCPDMPPNHIGKWTPNSLTFLLKELGFEVEVIETEPSSWGRVRDYLHLKFMSDAAKSGTLAAKVYKNSIRPFRLALMALLSIPTLIRFLPVIGEVRKGGAFGVIARVVD